MLLRSTTKPPILGVLTKHHISEAFRIDFVNKSICFYGQQQNHQFYSINLCCCGQQQNHQFKGFDQKSYF